MGIPGQVGWQEGQGGLLYFVTVQKDELPDARSMLLLLSVPDCISVISIPYSQNMRCITKEATRLGIRAVTTTVVLQQLVHCVQLAFCHTLAYV